MRLSTAASTSTAPATSPSSAARSSRASFQTLDDIDLRDVSVMYWDGRHDNWQAGPRSEPWPIFTGVASARSA